MDKTSELIRGMVDAGCVGIEFTGSVSPPGSSQIRYSASCFYNHDHIEAVLCDTPFAALSELLDVCVSKAKKSIQQSLMDLDMMKRAADKVEIKLTEELE